MSENAIRMAGVSRFFGGVRAVDRLDLSIGRGETVALLGANGAGKSTTINMVLGLLPPDEGRVELFGGSPAAGVRNGRVGAMLQSAGFVQNATVRELVDLARAVYPRPMPADRILRTAGLTELAGRRLDKISSGEAQRARFAFALAGEPDLLVLDEPTTGMDVGSRQAFWAAMRQYAGDGHTVVFATHYLAEADDFAERVVVMANGRVIADGSGVEIKKFAGGRTVSFALAGGPAADLHRLPGVQSVEVRGDRAWLRTDDADATVVGLVQSGRTFRDIEVAGAGLEAAFLELTGAGRQ
jgi:ABC-2 type transport system ATP-binding protein